MIDCYTWGTPNGVKVHIMLEECGLPYQLHAVNISKGEQFAPDFLKISPNNKIPAIIDQDGPDDAPFSLFESGAILRYLAQKAGILQGANARERHTIDAWLMFQMGSVGPMLGQAHHFRVFAKEKVPYAIERYTTEAQRLYSVIDRRLAESMYLGGATFSIADIATWPWLRSWDKQGVQLDDYPHLKKWYETVEARDAVARGVAAFTTPA